MTFTKEELHFAAEDFVLRGWRVVRIDNPVYGETEGALASLGVDYIACVAKAIREQYAGPLYGIGFSLGGFLLLKKARSFDRVVTIGAPCEPDRYLDKMPDHSLKALMYMAGSSDANQLRDALIEQRVVASDLGNVPLLLIHGGKDKTVPPDEMNRIASRAGGGVLHLTYPSESHGCMDALEEIWAECLEWFRVEPSDRKPLQVIESPPGILSSIIDTVVSARDARLVRSVGLRLAGMPKLLHRSAQALRA